MRSFKEETRRRPGEHRYLKVVRFIKRVARRGADGTMIAAFENLSSTEASGSLLHSSVKTQAFAPFDDSALFRERCN